MIGSSASKNLKNFWFYFDFLFTFWDYVTITYNFLESGQKNLDCLKSFFFWKKLQLPEAPKQAPRLELKILEETIFARSSPNMILIQNKS